MSLVEFTPIFTRNPLKFALIQIIVILCHLSEIAHLKIIPATSQNTSTSALNKLNFQSQVPFKIFSTPAVAPMSLPNVYKIPAKPSKPTLALKSDMKQLKNETLLNITKLQNATKQFQNGTVLLNVTKLQNPTLKDQKGIPVITPLNASISSSAAAGSSSSCLYSIDYSLADAHAKKFPRQNVKSMEVLAQNLVQPFQNNPVLKARAIFTWFHHNIAYDTVAFFGGTIKPKSIDETLRTGISVCQGYADLYAKLAQVAGLEVKVITGHAKGLGFVPIERTGGSIPNFSSNHAWNAVKLNGRWQLIDPAWGAGITNDNRQYVPKFDPKFFCSSPEEFRLRHFPANPEFQFSSKPISWNEYISMKEGPLIFLGFSDKGFSEFTLEPKLKTIRVDNKPVRFVIRSHCPDVPVKPENRVVLVLVSGGKYLMPLKMEEAGKLWSAEVDVATLKKAAGGTIQLSYIDRLGSKSGNGLTLQEFEKERDRQGYGLTGLALWDIRQ